MSQSKTEKFYFTAIAILLLGLTAIKPVYADNFNNTVAVYYVIPKDIQFEQSVYDRLYEATREIQAWYYCATRGETFELAFPEAVRVYFADKTRAEYDIGGVDPFRGPMIGEFANKGMPSFTPGVVTMLWFRGANLYAGANSGCGGNCGFGAVSIEAFPEFHNPDWTTQSCGGGVGVDAWPCTPLGAFAHELGHAIGHLPHPADVEFTRPYASHSVMQTHWNYPSFAPENDRPWGFLPVERATLRESPFIHYNVGTDRTVSCELPPAPRRPN